MSKIKMKMPQSYKELNQSEVEYDGGSNVDTIINAVGCALIASTLLCCAGYAIYNKFSPNTGYTPAPSKSGMWFTTNENSLNTVINMNGGIKSVYRVGSGEGLGYQGLAVETQAGQKICFGTLTR